MHVYEIVRRVDAMLLGVHVCIVSIHEDVGAGRPERMREEIRRPEDVVLCGPSSLGLPVQPMDQDDIDFRVRMCVYGRCLEARYLFIDRALESRDKLSVLVGGYRLVSSRPKVQPLRQ